MPYRTLACLTTGFILSTGAVQAATLTGAAAFGDWRDDRPGLVRHIAPGDLPPAFATRSSSNGPDLTEMPRDAAPQAPAGFSVQLFASGLESPRTVRVAPNGDIFIAETDSGRIQVMRAGDGAPRPERTETFATGLDEPFGIAFYPPGPDPQWVYVANTNSVERFPYRSGDLTARGRAQTVVERLTVTTGGHTTRDIQFSPDGRRMYVSIGSGSNVASDMSQHDGAYARDWDAAHGLGAAWGSEAGRADVLAFNPDGADPHTFATGIRNCVGLAVHPRTGDLWCSVNERDGLGDNLPPDYVTRVAQGGFYGWPWYYIGGNQDPRHKDERPDLSGHVTVPDVLVQPHSAPLILTFYAGHGPAAFPADYQGDGFVALHGSWNRARRTGYKVVRVRTQDGVPTGEYQDFLTGFVVSDAAVWGRPVGVAVAHDGALLVTEDGNGTMWRVAPR